MANKSIRIANIEKVQDMMNYLKDGSLDYDDLTKDEQELLDDIQLEIARFMPSPSKLNAASVLLSNTADKIFKYLEAEHKYRL